MKDMLKRWNTWWVSGFIDQTKLGIERKEKLEEVNKLMPAREIILLSGIRRAGKSTFIYQMINDLINKNENPGNILYFNFDEVLPEKTMETLKRIYDTFIELNNPKNRVYVFFDEIQNIENWENWIKMNYDLSGRKVKYVLTGSSSSISSGKRSKLLTGRIFTERIYPLSFKEYLLFKEFELKDFDLQRLELLHHILRYQNEGGFPEVVLDRSDYLKHRRLKEYYDGILFRDVVYSKEVREGAKLSELAEYCITNIGALLSYYKISNAIGLNVNTVKEYLYYLEEAHLVFQLKFFSYSLKKSVMIQKPRKIYCIDNGLRNAMSYKFSEDTGKLAENLVFVELMRRGNEIFYWKNKHEVDFIKKRPDNSLSAINVTYSDKISDREFAGLLEFKKHFDKTIDMTIITRDTEREEGDIRLIPLWKWLLD